MAKLNLELDPRFSNFSNSEVDSSPLDLLLPLKNLKSNNSRFNFINFYII